MAFPAAAINWRTVKFLIRAAEEAIPVAFGYLASQLDNNEEAEALKWVRWQCRAAHSTPAGTTEDLAQIKFDLVNLTGGAVDITWTAGDFAAVKTAFDTFLTTLKPYTGNPLTWTQYRAYGMEFNPDDPGPGYTTRPGKRKPISTSRPFKDTGPPLYVADFSIPGTAVGYQSPQVATSVTFRTAWARHWGRVYLPTPASNIDTYGRWTSAHRTAIANAVFDLQDDLAAAGFLIVVPVGQLANQAFHALLGVDKFVVDDIPDVQRRRRPKQVLARTIGVE